MVTLILKYRRCFRFQSEIGFGKLETYVKLDKLGEVGFLTN